MGFRAGSGPRLGEATGAFIVLNVESIKTRFWSVYPASRDPGLSFCGAAGTNITQSFHGQISRGTHFLFIISPAQPVCCHGPLGVCVPDAIHPGPMPSLPPAFLAHLSWKLDVIWTLPSLSVPTSHQFRYPPKPLGAPCCSRTASHATHIFRLFLIRPSSTGWLEGL